MKKTQVLQKIRTMRFKEVYEKRAHKRLTVEQAADLLGFHERTFRRWSMKNHMRARLVNDALMMAVWARKPKKGLLWHTDRGSQYASDSHRLLLKQDGIRQSMSRKRDCWDNAVAESFFHSLKIECVYRYILKTKAMAKQVIFDYIEVFYNRQRLHSSNEYLSPVDYENICPVRCPKKCCHIMHEIWQAETREDSEAAFDWFVKTYKSKYPKATSCLENDRKTLLVFYEFHAQHWQSVRTTNPIESPLVQYAIAPSDPRVV